MTLQIFIVFVTDAQSRPYVGVVLGRDKQQATTKAIDHCKKSFGEGSRVTLIQHVAEANIPLLLRTRAYRLLGEYDQMVFAATQLDEMTTKAVQLMEMLHQSVKAITVEIEKQKGKQQ